MKKIILSLMFLVMTGVFAANAQIRVVVRAPYARVVAPFRPVLVRPIVPILAIRPVVPVLVARPIIPVLVRPVAFIRPLRVVRRRVFLY